MFKTDFNFYGLMVILSITLSMVVTWYNGKNYFSRQGQFYFMVYQLIGIVFGGKYYTLLTHYEVVKNRNFVLLGMSSLGSLIGLIIMTLIFVKQYNKDRKKVLNIMAPSLPLMYGVGKIGCFLAGCCGGFVYSGIGAVTYKYSTSVTGELSYFPVQIVEAIVFIGLFLLVMSKFKKGKSDCFRLAIVLSCSLKFGLEFLRLREGVKFLSINQIFCLILLGCVVILEVMKKIRSEKKGKVIV